MDFPNIRITQRAERGGHAVERTIEIASDPQPRNVTNIKLEIEVGDVSKAVRSVLDEVTPARLEWSGTLCDGKRVDYAGAEKACAALGAGWRLPTRPELESILDLSRHSPAIDTERFPGTKDGYYWSSTPCAWSSAHAWCVNFLSGGVSFNRRDDYSAFARAVRAVPVGQ